MPRGERTDASKEMARRVGMYGPAIGSALHHYLESEGGEALIKSRLALGRALNTAKLSGDPELGAKAEAAGLEVIEVNVRRLSERLTPVEDWHVLHTARMI